MNAHLNEELLLSVRGQFIQGFGTECDADDGLTVAPFMDAEGAEGYGGVTFEEAGSMACFDFVIKPTKEWEPIFWHIHNASPGNNGPVVINFSELVTSSKRVKRAKGCIAVDPPLANAILMDEGMYYFDFHGAGARTDSLDSLFFQVLRCPPLNDKKGF